MFDRANYRRLLRLTSPNQSWLHLIYNEAGHIAEIDDSRDRKVLYDYDERGRLATVRYPSGDVLLYEYDSMQHLLTFRVAQDARATPRVLLRNEYAHGRLVKQIFADGNAYTYSYFPAGTEPIKMVTVRTPDNRIFDLEVSEEDSTVRERDLQ